MGRLTISNVTLLGLLATLGGCAHQISVPRYQVTDLATGRHYTAEGREINKTAGGVTFHDETGERVTLPSYSERRIEDAHFNVEYDVLNAEWKRVSRVQ